MPRTKNRKPNPKGPTQSRQLRFSELFRRACTEGPQVLTQRGNEQVVVEHPEHYAQLTERVRQPKSLVRFFAESPLTRVKLDLSRDVDSEREINR